MSLIAVPASVPLKRRVPWALTTFIAVGVVAVAWAIYALVTREPAGVAPGQFVSVAPMDMDITIAKEGELQAVSNVEIVCPVEGQSVILDIAREGSYVRKGDVVVKLDSSEIERKIEQAQLDLQKAEADLTAAKESKEIQDSTNVANLEAANVELILARLDLQQYVEGTFPSELQNAKTAVDMAKISVKNMEDELAQTRSLFSKGFVTAADVKKAELALLTAKNDLEKKSTDLMVLEKYTHEKELTDRRNKVAQAEKKLVRVQRENSSQLAQKVADLQAKAQTLDLRKQQMEHMQEQLAACTIKAPGDGMVVYATSGRSDWGRRDTPMAPGATVRMQELLIRLPDTSAMKAVSRISEQQVAKLRVDQNNPIRATIDIVGQGDPITGWLSNISIMADSSSRWFSPDTKEYPVDVTLDRTPQGLKPGMSVKTRIFVDRLRQALAVPLAAVYAAGVDNYVFIREGAEPRPTKVTIGQVNDTHAQITTGVKAGQQVLLLQAGQGRDLLEKAGIKVERRTSPTTQAFDPGAVPPPTVTRQPGEADRPGAAGNSGSDAGSAGGDRPRGERRGGRNRGQGDGAAPTTAPAPISGAPTTAPVPVTAAQ